MDVCAVFMIVLGISVSVFFLVKSLANSFVTNWKYVKEISNML